MSNCYKHTKREATWEYGVGDRHLICTPCYNKAVKDSMFFELLKPTKITKGNNIMQETTGYIIKKDGNMWMCARDNFVNLQESNSEFGETPTIAMANFLQREDEMQREWQERMEDLSL